MEIARRYGLLFIFFILGSTAAFGQDVDPDLLNSLKIEANHNLSRLKNFKEEKKNNKVYQDEREKALGLYLEEQENWELIRERGLSEYKKKKKSLSPEEDGPEYREEQAVRRQAIDKYEKSRKIQVRTRVQAIGKSSEIITQLEDEELGLKTKRPRYELRKRGHNKWVKAGGSSSRPSMGGSFGDDSGSFPPPPPPPMDYTPAPPPLDTYEDVPPPPPAYDYGSAGAMPYDSGYGDIPPPPPPPPPVDYDF